MKKNNVNITDELLACYLEGKLTDLEKSAVELYLSEHEDAMDAVILTKYEMGYERAKRRFYLIGVAVFVLLAVIALLVWRWITPLQMKVNVIEDKAYAIPALPFEGGVLHCEYAGYALQSITVDAARPTVFLDEIPYRLRRKPVHLVFEADGYQTIDTLLKVQPSVELRVKRSGELGLVFGRVVDFETGQPVVGATVSLLDDCVSTDSLGRFRIEIPYDKQDDTQRVLISKEGYQSWDAFYRPSSTEPWLISLEKEVRP